MKRVWTETEAIAWLRDEADRLGRTPSTTDMGNAVVLRLVRMFGRISEAQRRAGLPLNRPGRKRKR